MLTRIFATHTHTTTINNHNFNVKNFSGKPIHTHCAEDIIDRKLRGSSSSTFPLAID